MVELKLLIHEIGSNQEDINMKFLLLMIGMLTFNNLAFAKECFFPHCTGDCCLRAGGLLWEPKWDTSMMVAGCQNLRTLEHLELVEIKHYEYLLYKKERPCRREMDFENVQ